MDGETRQTRAHRSERTHNAPEILRTAFLELNGSRLKDGDGRLRVPSASRHEASANLGELQRAGPDTHDVEKGEEGRTDSKRST